MLLGSKEGWTKSSPRWSSVEYACFQRVLAVCCRPPKQELHHNQVLKVSSADLVVTNRYTSGKTNKQTNISETSFLLCLGSKCSNSTICSIFVSWRQTCYSTVDVCVCVHVLGVFVFFKYSVHIRGLGKEIRKEASIFLWLKYPGQTAYIKIESSSYLDSKGSMEVYSQLPSQDKAIFKVQIGTLWLYTIKVRVFFRNGIFLAFFGNLFQYLIFLTVNLSFFFFFF